MIAEAILLGLALSVDSLAVSTSCALKSKMDYSRGFLLAITFAVFQAGFPFLGAMLGIACKSLIESIDHWIAFGLLLIVGGKMIIDGIRNREDDTILDVSKFLVICTLAIATSIDAFVVGIGLGMEYNWFQMLMIVAIVGIITFGTSMCGIYLGLRNLPVNERWATIIAGLVLIGLGTKTLMEHLIM